jgi:glycerol-3-phosphate dehydrogenase (NAD(P)+)
LPSFSSAGKKVDGGKTIVNGDGEKAAVLGAGYMGSAITFPLSDSGHEVHLWGTWLDDDIIDAAKTGLHPKLGRPLRDGVTLLHSDRLKEAVAGAQYIFIAVSSEGFIPVFELLIEHLLEHLGEPRTILCLTKGFVEKEGRVMRTSEWALTRLFERFGETALDWVSVGGPVKAVELSRAIPSASLYGVEREAVTDTVRRFRTPYYRVIPFRGVESVEICASFKNVYAVGIGICDGMFGNKREDEYHNASALLFTEGIREMAVIVQKAGGDTRAVFGLGGTGDLYVTGRSGRNREFGELVGAGGKPKESFERMLRAGRLAEGYDALEKGVRWWESTGGEPATLPLLYTLHDIIIRGKNPLEAIYSFIKGYGATR